MWNGWTTLLIYLFILPAFRNNKLLYVCLLANIYLGKWYCYEHIQSNRQNVPPGYYIFFFIIRVTFIKRNIYFAFKRVFMKRYKYYSKISQNQEIRRKIYLFCLENDSILFYIYLWFRYGTVCSILTYFICEHFPLHVP